MAFVIILYLLRKSRVRDLVFAYCLFVVRAIGSPSTPLTTEVFNIFLSCQDTPFSLDKSSRLLSLTCITYIVPMFPLIRRSSCQFHLLYRHSLARRSMRTNCSLLFQLKPSFYFENTNALQLTFHLTHLSGKARM